MRTLTNAVAIKTIPAERRRRSVILAQGGCTSCCCCCCLHTLGALGGAIVVSLNPRLHTDTKCEPPQPTALNRFWLSLAVCCWICGGILGWLITDGMRGQEYRALEAVASFALITIIFFPVVQLAALIATAIWTVIAPLNRKSQLSSLGWLTLWSLGGFAVGIVVMLLGIGVLMLFA